MKFALLVVLFLAVTASFASDRSTYAGEEARPLKSLSSSEIQSLVQGDGMGFAKLAELNHYPGPKHVLELANILDLTPTQLTSTKALFDEMRASASALGSELVAAELKLDRSFEDNTIDAESLERELLMLGELRARIRYVHLEAHLRQEQILTETQIAEYDRIRGYGRSDDAHADHSQHR